MKFRVFLEQEEDGAFVAQAPSLPGCIAQGRTRKDVLSNILKAIVLYLESLESHGERIPPSIYEEFLEVPI